MQQASRKIKEFCKETTDIKICLDEEKTKLFYWKQQLTSVNRVENKETPTRTVLLFSQSEDQFLLSSRNLESEGSVQSLIGVTRL